MKDSGGQCVCELLAGCVVWQVDVRLMLTVMIDGVGRHQWAWTIAQRALLRAQQGSALLCCEPVSL